jgi:hypothetical protein
MCKEDTCRIVLPETEVQHYTLCACLLLSVWGKLQVLTSQGFSSSKCQNHHVHVYSCIGRQCWHHYYLSVVRHFVYKIHATDITNFCL